MDPIRTYTYLVLAREKIFDWCRPLTAEQYHQKFDIGLKSLAATFTHMLISEWYYIERVLQNEVPPYEQWDLRDEEPPTFVDLEARWHKQTEVTRATIEGVTDWRTNFEYRVTDENGQRLIITTSPADQFTQLALHEVHHRAQAMAILKRLNVPAEDLDFNWMMMPRRNDDS